MSSNINSNNTIDFNTLSSHKRCVATLPKKIEYVIWNNHTHKICKNPNCEGECIPHFEVSCNFIRQRLLPYKLPELRKSPLFPNIEKTQDFFCLILNLIVSIEYKHPNPIEYVSYHYETDSINKEYVDWCDYINDVLDWSEGCEITTYVNV